LKPLAENLTTSLATAVYVSATFGKIVSSVVGNVVCLPGKLITGELISLKVYLVKQVVLLLLLRLQMLQSLLMEIWFQAVINFIIISLFVT
jgi:large-conductance mechanosensitive channel